MITWKSFGVSLTGEFTTTRRVFLSGGLDPNMNNVTGARSFVVFSVLLRTVIKEELRPKSSHSGSLVSHNQGLFQMGKQT